MKQFLIFAVFNIKLLIGLTELTPGNPLQSVDNHELTSKQSLPISTQDSHNAFETEQKNKEIICNKHPENTNKKNYRKDTFVLSSWALQNSPHIFFPTLPFLTSERETWSPV